MSDPKAKAYPRALAIRILTRVLSEREPLDEALNAVGAEARLAGPERAWLQDVCSGTLRWKGRLDLAIDSVSLKKKPTGWLRKVLQVSAYQLIAQDRALPAAVVSESVDAIRKKEGEAPARFVNACLRKIAEHGSQYRELELGASAAPSEAAAWASLPEWLWSRLVSDHGLEWSKAYARASLERPVTWIRVRDGSEVSGADWVGPPSDGIPGAFQVRQMGSIAERPGFKEGNFFVQDISSQTLVQEICSEARRGLSGSSSCASGQSPDTTHFSALDLCAAPGGKSAGLAWNGFDVTATDRPELGEARFALLRQTLDRVAPGARIIPRAQVSELPPQDLVWVDAPCSGTGILRRHPDVRWLRREEELASLKAIQQSLLKDAWERTRPGGFLAYSVCSVLKEEGPEAIRLAGLVRSGVGEKVREWFLTPQNPPFGDGFWAILLRKSP